MRLILFFSALFGIQALASQLLLKNATILDPSDSKIQRGHLLVEGQKISKLLDSVPVAYSGEVLDVRGKWVIPGLRDYHVHAYGTLSPTGGYHQLGLEGSARSMLYAGVTSFLDLFHQENEILELRDRQRTGNLGAVGIFSDIFAAGPIFTSSGGHGTEYGQFTRVINTPEQAELEIRAVAYKKPDVIKIVYDHALPHFTTLALPTLKRALEVAKTLGIKTVIHIGTWEDAEQAIDLGADAITHTYSTPISAKLVEKFRRKNVAYIPTLSVHMGLMNITQDLSLLDLPLLKEMVPASFLATYKDETAYLPLAKGWLQWQKNGAANVGRNFLALADAGVRIVAGTDAGNMGTFQGYSLHRELELMVQAGASNELAIKAATTHACAFVGQDCRIRPGANADLLILGASPLVDISHTQQIAHVIYRGTVVDRAHLRELFLKAPVQTRSSETGEINVPCLHIH